MNNDTGQRYPTIIAGLFGLLLIIFGNAASTWWPIAKDALVGAGASVIASVVIFVIFFSKDQLSYRVMKYGVKQLFHDRYKELHEKFWADFLSSAKRQVRILGVANHGYVTKEGLIKDHERDVFRSLLIKGNVTITILWLDPTKAIAEERDEEETRGTREDTIRSIQTFHKFRQSLPVSAQHKFKLKMYNATPTCGITWVDDNMVVTHYLSHRSNLGAPGFVLTYSVIDKLLSRVGHDHEYAALYDVYGDNLKAIERSATEITEASLSQLKVFFDKLPKEPSEADMRDDEPPQDESAESVSQSLVGSTQS